MSNKTTTTTSNQYSQNGMNNYNSFAAQLGPTLSSYLSNPLGNSMFNQQLAGAQNTASQLGQRNISNSLVNARTGGGILGNSGSFMQNMVNRNMLQNSSMQAGAFNSALGGALQNRNFALAGMEGYNPLQTGQRSVQQQSSGIGGILGGLASVGLNAAMPGIGSMLGGAGFKDGYN